MGLPPSKVSAVAMVTMLMTFAEGGGYRIKGGAQRLADAFVKGLKNSGGELLLRRPVTEIVREGGRAAGIIAGGQLVRAKAVVSAIDASKTYEMAGLDLDKKLEPSTSFFMVYLGLNKYIDMPDSMGFYPGYDIEGTFSDTKKDIASAKASVEIINYSRISPEMAPPGCSTVMLMSKAAYAYGKPWQSCKREEADRLIALAGKALPELADNIAYAEAATPLTLERYTANNSGAAFGWEQGPENRRNTAISALPGLYMAGHWTYPGGGIESVAASGLVAAEKAASAI
jgi:phytoene dehydrogenase-like protein